MKEKEFNEWLIRSKIGKERRIVGKTKKVKTERFKQLAQADGHQ